jgi:hypothetical protein
LRGEAGDQSGPGVEGPGLVDSAVAQGLPAVVEDVEGRRVGLRARFKSRDRALEQQLVAHRVLDAEVEEQPGLATQAVDGVI